MRKADEVEGRGDERAEGEIDRELEEKVARDTLRCVAHGLSHEGEVAVAGETDEAVAEVFSLQENEEREDNGEEGCGERFDDAAQLVETAGRVADFIELGELMCMDALDRNESCGGHFREEYQTEDGEALRDDDKYMYVSAWEYKGDSQFELHKESLDYEVVHPSQRSYK